VNGKNILVDYGMEQGTNVYVNQPLPVPEAEIDYVLITHAHVDHTGLLPLLYAHGFRGEVHTTKATSELCTIMLKDCAFIQESEAEWKNRKGRRKGQEEVQPLYTLEDAEGVLTHFYTHSYLEEFTLCEGVQVRFVDAGHLLGSASIELWLTEAEVTKKIVFSGDIGNTNQPLIKDPQYIEEADYVVMESTYGNRNHGARDNYEEKLLKIMMETFDKGGNVVIPCFAVGRTQEMLYFLRKIKISGRLGKYQNVEVYVDSPMAVEATHVFHANFEECFDEEAMEIVNSGRNPITFQGLKLSVSSQESKAINDIKTPKVILSAAGMCDAGRIRHHLKHNLWRSESTILFAGYQAVGSLGRALLDGAESVKIFGEEIAVNARLEKIEGVSGHADHDGLLTWIEAFTKKPRQIFVVHGEDTVCDLFAKEVQERMGVSTNAPYSGAVYDLAQGVWMKEGVPEYIQKKTAPARKANAVYMRLVAAGQRLAALIKQCEGMANKDLAKLTDQINGICDRWER
jgi:metallo-beta-lactamase family protein